MLYEQGVDKPCPYSTLGHVIRTCPVGNYLIVVGQESNPFCPQRRVGIAGAGERAATLADVQPRSAARSWQAFSMSCAPVASGTPCRVNMALVRPCIATSSAGTEPGSSNGCGRPV